MARHNVAELLVDVLAEAGVRRIYGIVMAILSAASSTPFAPETLQWIAEA